MLTVQRQSSSGPAPVRATARSLPKWLQNRFAGRVKQTARIVSRSNGTVTLNVAETNDLLLASAIVPGAAALPALMLQRRTADAYSAIHELTAQRAWHPIRIWNWIPDIHAAMGGAVDRYMVFNAGRFAAYYSCYERGCTFETAIATATGVGHDGEDLIIQVLAAANAGTPVENPLQIQSYRYSQQFGPMPPCFARATLAPEGLPDTPDLFIGGTASVCGEASAHIGNVEAQSTETLNNLAHLIAEASRVRGGAMPTKVDVATELRRFESMRIFFVKPEHAEMIVNIVWPYVDHLEPSHFEIVRTDICRRELLVEIEGTARITR